MDVGSGIIILSTVRPSVCPSVCLPERCTFLPGFRLRLQYFPLPWTHSVGCIASYMRIRGGGAVFPPLVSLSLSLSAIRIGSTRRDTHTHTHTHTQRERRLGGANIQQLSASSLWHSRAERRRAEQQFLLLLPSSSSSLVFFVHGVDGGGRRGRGCARAPPQDDTGRLNVAGAGPEPRLEVLARPRSSPGTRSHPGRLRPSVCECECVCVCAGCFFSVFTFHRLTHNITKTHIGEEAKKKTVVCVLLPTRQRPAYNCLLVAPSSLLHAVAVAVAVAAAAAVVESSPAGSNNCK